MADKQKGKSRSVRIDESTYYKAFRYRKATGVPIGRFIKNAVDRFVAEIAKNEKS